MDNYKNTLPDKPQRRIFLKKAVYQAPVLYALGHLVKPTLLQADTSGGPPGPPGGMLPFSTSNKVAAPQKRRTLKF
jgi:hypothetical protein